ncbi:siderophore-interacting protein [Acuticoccus mangrovi]|uniref:Siderophore-interacting protein n=1 Tax=Acuticoccus mangrovi TaxID=2796142 RepID=A0A934ILA2_9HYPH|nr:siderophore-interacting protein [Acuticoccus mangrovi]MBJ3778714.1 siderophore-interacting protein [Acuticoccus mangrovi]
MTHSDSPLATASRYEGEIPHDLLAHLRSQIEEFGFPVRATERGLSVHYDHSDVAVSLGMRRLDIEITATSEGYLHQTREGVIYLLDHIFPAASAAMVWSGVDTTPRVPPNFHLAEVVGSERVSTNFLRITLACEGTEALATGGGMHFALLLPPEGRTPVWPMVDGNGRTVWPEGEDAIHRPRYTFVDLDPAAGRFTFDVFEHEGGRATGWAQRAKPGDVVAITGPGGGGFPPGDALVIAGDETALPAIRRILAHSPASRTGTAIIETADPDDRCALDHPPGIEVVWTLRGDPPGLWPRLRDVALPAGDVFVWFAAEQALVREAREHFRSLGLPRTQTYLAAYWTR